MKTKSTSPAAGAAGDSPMTDSTTAPPAPPLPSTGGVYVFEDDSLRLIEGAAEAMTPATGDAA